MKIKYATPRLNWQKKCEDSGFFFHSIDNRYWCEDYYYELTQKEIDVLTLAANEVHAMYMNEASDIIKKGDYQHLNLSAKMISDIESSWQKSQHSVDHIFSRFDFSYGDLTQPPKLLEYNADTPTTLLEGGVVQLKWQQEVFPMHTQFNALEDNLLARWKSWAQSNPDALKVYFACMHSAEDEANLYYMQDIAQRAGLIAESIFVEDICYSSDERVFTDTKGEIIRHCFKLYPWEWLEKDDFFAHMTGNITFIEPPWKLLLSNKAVLVNLWEKNKNHPNLLPSYHSLESMAKNCPDIKKVVEKQVFGREGSNMKIIENNVVIEETLGLYKGASVVQQYWPLPCLNGRWPTAGVWMVGDKPSCLGFRDDSVKITQDTCWFAPHCVVPD